MGSSEFGNLISLISLVVALVAAILAGALSFFGKDSDKLGKRLDSLEEKEKARHRENWIQIQIAESTVRLFVRLKEALDNQHTMLSFLLNKNGVGERGRAHYHSARERSIRTLNKYMQTLLLFSDNKIWRESAIKQLSEDLGEADTLRLLVEMLTFEVELRDDLRRAIDTLEERLSIASQIPSADPPFGCR